MKRLFTRIAAACAYVLLLVCCQPEAPSSFLSAEVSFRVTEVDAAATKAAPYTSAMLPNLSLGLAAYTYGTSGAAATAWTRYPEAGAVVRADNDRTRTGHSDKWVPVQEAGKRTLLWPRQGFIRYFAYAPYTASVTISDPSGSTGPTLRYRVDDDVKRQTDLLVTGASSTKEYPGDPSVFGIDVPLEMMHALTGVRFRLTDVQSLKSVTVSGIYNEGRLDLRDPAAWTGLSGSAGYTLDNPALQAEAGNPGFNVVTDDNIMLLMPQTLPSGAKITAVVQSGSTTRTIEAAIDGQVWRPGTLITYTITKSAITGFGVQRYNLYPNPGFEMADFDYTVTPESKTLWAGESFILLSHSTATPQPDFSYRTTVTSLLDVRPSTDGKQATVKALAPGQATVSVSARRGNTTRDKACAVTIQQLQANSMSLNHTNLNLTFGRTSALLVPTVLYHDGTASGQRLDGGWSFSSSDADIVKVNPAGLVTTATRVGTAEITCTITKGDVTESASCRVTVAQPYTFTISPDNLVLWTGGNVEVTASSSEALTYIFEGDENYIDLQNITANSIRVVAKSSPCDTTLRVYGCDRPSMQGLFEKPYNDYPLRIQKLEDLSLSQTNISLPAGGSTTLTPTVLYHDGTASGQQLSDGWTWSGGDPTVATVTAGGLVTAVAAGTATLTCSITKGNVTLSKQCTVTVN